jgi:glycosyltransferase involved in cell wall biosynthesis
MNNIKISIIMSNYNGGKKLYNTIQSILSQSFKEFELVIIDDGSTDESNLIIEKFDDDRIKLIINKNNLGLTKSLIKGIKQSNSKYIARIDVGDYWDKDKLKNQYRFLEENPEYVICATQVNYFDDNGVVNKSWFSIEDEDIRKRFLSQEGVFEHSSIMFRNIINYREQFRYSQDLDLYLRISFLGKLHCIDKELTYSEINLDGITLKKRYLQRQFQQYAYKFYQQRLNHKKDDIEKNNIQILSIRDTFLDKILNNYSMYFYRKYVFNRTLKKNIFLWSIPLFFSLIIYPPYLFDYMKKLKGVILKWLK